MLARVMKWMALPALVTLAVGLQLREAPGLLGRDPNPAPSPAPRFAEELDWRGSLKGNVHVHTRMSDGDSSPARVVDWYRRHGYDFVAITDHNRHYAPPSSANKAPGDIVVLPGEEVTMAARGKPVHVNALCTSHTVGPAHFERRSDAVSWAVDQIRAQRGVALVNHPNFVWTLEARHIAAAPGAQLLDIYNGHPDVHSEGYAKRPSVEVIWQTLLDQGSSIAPVAVDDAHAFTLVPLSGIPRSRPGTGWVGVFADARDPRSICDALGAGRTYASQGPEVTRIQLQDDEMVVWTPESQALVRFIGGSGELLAEVSPQGGQREARMARYRLRGDEPFVRARIDSPRGKAWTPAFRTRRAPR